MWYENSKYSSGFNVDINSSLLEKAILFATEKHSGVIRKGNGLPYITHPIAVMTILNSIKRSNNPFLIGIVAILHDVVEDCNVSINEISEKFGLKVAAIVQELTSDKEKIKVLGKKEYLLNKMLSMSSYALRIKLADRLHNVSDLSSLSEAQINKSIQETSFILEGLNQRSLTKTHKKLIKMIKKQLKQYESNKKTS